MTIREVYEKHKAFDRFFCEGGQWADPRPEDRVAQIAYDSWLAIKEYAEAEGGFGEGSIKDALRAASEAGGNAWDDIEDPAAEMGRSPPLHEDDTVDLYIHVLGGDYLIGAKLSAAPLPALCPRDWHQDYDAEGLDPAAFEPGEVETVTAYGVPCGLATALLDRHSNLRSLTNSGGVAYAAVEPYIRPAGP